MVRELPAMDRGGVGCEAVGQDLLVKRKRLVVVHQQMEPTLALPDEGVLSSHSSHSSSR